MKKFLVVVCAVTLVIGVMGQAVYALSVVDPDAFADGTDISNAFPGVTLTAVGAVGTPDVFSSTSPNASTGTQVFGHTANPQTTTWGNGTWEYLQVDFAVNATYVALDFIANDSSDQNGVLAAYDSSGVLLGSDSTVGTFSTGEIATLTVAANNIAFVLALGDPVGDLNNINALSGGTDSWTLDNLQYEPVPEPGTVLLLGSGILGLIALKRKRRK